MTKVNWRQYGYGFVDFIYAIGLVGWLNKIIFTIDETIQWSNISELIPKKSNYYTKILF